MIYYFCCYIIFIEVIISTFYCIVSHDVLLLSKNEDISYNFWSKWFQMFAFSNLVRGLKIYKINYLVVIVKFKLTQGSMYIT
jgi:hypothetical protein